ncbi:hypothetical protein TNCT_115011 [Trichonephila clavata]|uniref:Uncharacterized protein n=1 Tax=Trichonephila clavata TaxID=2740835 RepID=A0A8X6IB55_TRICU|nr:hypothetical protein TNCT_115011 [Trichonephila clavata]
MKNNKKSSPHQPSPQELRSKSPVSDWESMDTQVEQKTSLTPAPLPPPLSELEEDLQTLAHSVDCGNFCEHLEKILLSIDNFHFNQETDRSYYVDKIENLFAAAIDQRKELRASEDRYYASVDERYNGTYGNPYNAPFTTVKGKKNQRQENASPTPPPASSSKKPRTEETVTTNSFSPLQSDQQLEPIEDKNEDVTPPQPSNSYQTTRFRPPPPITIDKIAKKIP